MKDIYWSNFQVKYIVSKIYVKDFFFFFRLQPNSDVRKIQLDAWCALVLSWGKSNNVSQIDVTEASSLPVFRWESCSVGLHSWFFLFVCNINFLVRFLCGLGDFKYFVNIPKLLVLILLSSNAYHWRVISYVKSIIFNWF